MKNTLFILFIATGLILLLGADKPACSSSEKPQCSKQCDAIKKAILATHDKIIAAAEKQDAEQMFSYILENDKGAIIQDGRLFSRQEALNMVKDGYVGTASIDYTFTHRLIKVLSPTTAILTTAGQVIVSRESGRSFTSVFANTSVFVLKDDGWKIIHGHHSTPNPQPYS